MITLIFAIWDKKAEAFVNEPFYARSKGIAIRAFRDLANSKDNDIGKHPEDYGLHHIGDFNHNNGTILSADEATRSPVHLVNALDLIEKE